MTEILLLFNFLFLGFQTGYLIFTRNPNMTTSVTICMFGFLVWSLLLLLLSPIAIKPMVIYLMTFAILYGLSTSLALFERLFWVTAVNWGITLWHIAVLFLL